MTVRTLRIAWPALALLGLGVGFGSAAAQQAPGEPITFPSHGSQLRAVFYRATTPGTHPTAVLFTGFPGNGTDVLGLGPALPPAGWNALFFNPRGFHQSEGEYLPSRGLEDAASALAFLRSSSASLGVDTGRIAAVGYSHGGWTALMTTSREPGIKCVAAIAPDNLGLDGRRLQSDTVYRAVLARALKGAADRGFVRGAGFDAAVAELTGHATDYDLTTYASPLAARPVLVLGGWRDDGPTLEQYIVPLVRALRAAGNARVTPVTLDDDHTFRTTRPELQRTIVGWLESACAR